MAKQVRGARANKPNDSFGTINNPNLYRNKYREDVYKDDEEEKEVKSDEVGTEEQSATQQDKGFIETKNEETQESHDYKKRYDDLKKHYDAVADAVLLHKLGDHDTIEKALASYGEGAEYSEKVLNDLLDLTQTGFLSKPVKSK